MESFIKFTTVLIVIKQQIMPIRFLIVFLSLCFLSCKKEDRTETDKKETVPMAAFDKIKWKTKENRDYPYRDKMLDYLMTSDTLKKLKKEEVLNLLGQPDRIDSTYLFYRINQQRLYFFPLHTKTLVIKLKENDSVKSVMIHE